MILAISSVLEPMCWTLFHIASCLRASRWPALDPESSYGGMMVLQAFAGAPVPADTVWTDGSFGSAGAGAEC